MLPIVLPIFQTEKIVHVHQKLRRGTGTAQHAGNHKYHVHKTATERFEVGRCRGIAPDGAGSPNQPRIHGDGGAVVGQGCFVILVDKMFGEKFNIPVRQLLSVHFLNPVGQQPPVQADKIGFGQLSHQRGDVLVLNIGIRIIFGSAGCIGRITVVGQKLQLLHRLTILGVPLAVKHERFGHLEEALVHQRLLHLVLNILHLDFVVDIQVTQYL